MTCSTWPPTARSAQAGARPFASGDLQLNYGALGPLLLTLGLAFAWVGISFYAFLLLLFYVVVTTAYSAYLKTKPLVDVFTLAGLYTVRMLAGGVATRIHVSIWRLGFSLFVFLSLAFLKRASELTVAGTEGRRPSSRRAYRPDDEGLLRSMGITAAFTATLALSLYLSSDVARQHYLAPSWLWLVVPLVLFAQCRLWLSGTRGYMTDDPDRLCLQGLGVLDRIRVRRHRARARNAWSRPELSLI
jgi:4-hydroxybenzoate polyprenyltransferase